MNITVTMIFQKQIFKTFYHPQAARGRTFTGGYPRDSSQAAHNTIYLHKQLNALQSQMLTIQQTISEMDRLSGQLPVCQSLDQLAGMLADTDFCRKILPESDGIPGCPAAGTVFVDGISGYAGYGISAVLWQKITQHTIEHAGTDLKMMSRYLQYISPEQIDATNINSISAQSENYLSDGGEIIRVLWKS